MRRIAGSSTHRKIENHIHRVMERVVIAIAEIQRLAEIHMIVKMAVKVETNKRRLPMHHP